jgi:urease accessory protein UreF
MTQQITIPDSKRNGKHSKKVGKRDALARVSPRDMAVSKRDRSEKKSRKLMSELLDEMKNSKKLSSRAVDVAVIAAGVGIGVSAVVVVHHYATRTASVGA